MTAVQGAFRWESMNDLNDRLAAAFCRFNEGGLEGVGRLVQAWEPKIDTHGNIFLDTKGLPVSICGTGDVLALFRYVCCRYQFFPDPSRMDSLGVVGRVFATGEPEICGDVQNCGSPTYLRTSEATQCGVRSTMCLPLFAAAARSAVVAVLEVVDLTRDDSFTDILARLVTCLQMVGLYTVNFKTLSHIQSAFLSLSIGEEDDREDVDVYM